MKSLMVRLLMLLTAAMLLAIPGPAMADDLDDLDIGDLGFRSGDLDHNFGNDDIGINDSRILSDILDDKFDDEDCDDDDIEVGILSNNDNDCHDEGIGDDDDDIEVGERHDAITWLNEFFRANEAEQNAV